MKQGCNNVLFQALGVCTRMAGDDDEWEFPGFAAACSSPWDKSLLGSGQWGGLLLRAAAASAGPLLAPMFHRLQVKEGRSRRQEAGGRMQEAGGRK